MGSYKTWIGGKLEEFIRPQVEKVKFFYIAPRNYQSDEGAQIVEQRQKRIAFNPVQPLGFCDAFS